MDGATIQARIYAGFAKVAKRVGAAYDHYRFASPIDPVVAGNKLAALPCAFTARTRAFANPQRYDAAAWLLYADGAALAPRDILIGPYGTWYVADMQPLMPIQAVLCNHTVTIERPGYTTTGAIEPDNTLIARGLPIFSQNTRVDIKQPEFGANTAGVAITHWAAFIPMAEGTLQQHDILTDEAGVRYELDAPDYTPMGYVCSIRLAVAG